MRPCEGCPTICNGCEAAQRRVATAAGPDMSIWLGAPHLELSLADSQRAGVPHPGLPAPLPQGERVVWQGAPRPHSLARQLFHTHLLAVYFAVVAAWQAVAAIHDGRAASEVGFAAVAVLASGFLVIGLLELLGWLSARATIYTITNRRIVMRIGVAFINTVDIPFKVIESIQVKAGANGVGNISIGLQPGAVIPYLMLWPHARPWRVRRPEPMLRALADVEETARLLASHFEAAEHAGTTAAANVPSADTIARTPDAEPMAQQEPARAGASGAEARVIVFGAIAMILLTVIAVAWLPPSSSPADPYAGQTPERIYQLRFKHLGEERFAVVNTELQQTIGTMELGNDGLLRGALRGFERVRGRRGLPSDTDYQLVLWDTGQVTLSDLSTNQHVPLDAFGPTMGGVLNELLRMTEGDNS